MRLDRADDGFDRDGGYFVNVLTDIFDLAIFPVDHAEVVVVPRRTVDHRTVGGNAAGDDAVQESFVAEVLFGPGEFLGYAVTPNERIIHAVVALRVTDPGGGIGCRGGNGRQCGESGCAGIRNDRLLGYREDDVAAAVVVDEQLAVIGDGAGRGQVVEALGIGVQIVPVVRSRFDDDRLEETVRHFIHRVDETTGIGTARRDGGVILEAGQLAVVNIGFVAQLVDGDIGDCVACRDGHDGFAFVRFGVVGCGNREGRLIGLVGGQPAGIGLGAPALGGFDLDGQRCPALSSQSTGQSAEVDVIVGFRIGTSGKGQHR